MNNESTSFDRFSENLLDLLSIEVLEDTDTMQLFEKINFEQLFFTQKLVMLFAYLDAYLSDSFRILCNLEMESNKLKTLQHNMIKNYVESFDSRSIKNRLKLLGKDLKINFNMKKDVLENIYFAEQVRYIYIHNAGKIDKRFLKITRNKDVIEGEMFELTNDYVSDIHEIIRNLVNVMHKHVVDSFFT